MIFAVEEGGRTLRRGDMAGQAVQKRIGDRLDKFLSKGDDADRFLRRAVSYAVRNFGLDRDAFVKELTDGIMGSCCPTPSRCLKGMEAVLNACLQSALYGA